jgi:large repetitive protein
MKKLLPLIQMKSNKHFNYSILKLSFWILLLGTLPLTLNAGVDKFPITFSEGISAVNLNNDKLNQSGISAQSVSEECNFLLELNCAEIDSVYLQCHQPSHPDYTGYASLVNWPTGDNCPEVGEIMWSDSIWPSCPVVIIRTWSVSASDGSEASCVQLIFVNDTISPVITNPLSNINADCWQDVVDHPSIAATDNCDSNLNVICIDTYPDYQESTLCSIQNMNSPYELAPRIAWFQYMPGTEYMWSPRLFAYESGGFETFPDGTAHLYGVMSHVENDQLAWEFSIWMRGAYTWDEWSAMGRSYKDFIANGADDHMTWYYYEMDDTQENFMTGIRDYAGSYLTLTHMPVDYYYGFQVGNNSNSYTNTYGLGGWLLYSGEIHYQGTVHYRNLVHSDFNLDLECSNPIVENGCSITIVRTCYVSDDCGNYDSTSQTITIQDNEAPEFLETVEDIHVQCDQFIPPFQELTPIDNCDDDLLYYSFETSSLIGEETCEMTTAIGPGADWSIWLSGLPGVSDYYNFIAPGVMQVYGDGSAFLTGTVAASDNPNQIFNVFIRLENKRNWTEWSALGRDYKDDALLAGNNYLDWMYYELDGNNSFLVGAGDFEGSILNITHMPANFLFGFQCGLAANNKNANFGMSGWFFYNGILNGSEVSGAGDVNVDKECEPNNQENLCEYSIDRYWYAIDDCGNIASAHQNILVADTEGPEFTLVPGNLMLECTDEIPAADISQLAAQDNCSETVIITFEGDVTTGEACSITIIRTYQAIDECGNFVKHFQTINVLDNEAPVLNGVPADLLLTCSEAIPAAAIVTASDNCIETVMVSFAEFTTQGQCPQSYSIERTWTAVDSCGNTVSATQLIVVSDTEAPIISTCPANASYSCLANVPAADISLVVATDNCGEVNIAHMGDVVEGNECSGTITRTYRAFDECGNYSDCIQVIQYNDNVAPVFNNPPVNIYADCASVPGLSEVTATDNCSEVTITMTELFASGGCVGVLVRTYTATDVCGNTAIHEQYITLIDTVAPVFVNPPANTTYECDEVIPAPFNVTATDNCDSSVIVIFNETQEAGDCPQAYTIYRTWTATDTCENSVSYTQVINIVDTTAPEFNIENTEITVSCDSTIQIPSPVATDNCDDELELTAASSIFMGECANEWTESYSWTATDDCGNSSTVTFTVHYVDETAPVFTIVPQAIIVECGQQVPVTSAEATDNCGDVTITYADSDLLQDNCAGYYIRTFTAVDACGNSATATQIIDIIDTTAPVITACPANASYSCLSNVPAANTALVSATDVCSNVTITLHSEVVNGNDCAGTITRIYRATDACGNFADCVQVINYSDNVAPVFNNPPVNIYADCASVPALPEVTATDNCSDVTVTMTELFASGGCVGVLVRTYTATDACGNIAVHEQYITLVDTVAPVLANLPANGSYECDEVIPGPANVTATDNCDSSVIVEFSQTEQAGECPQEYTIYRTWTATDTCENSVSYTQVITITDETAPVFTWVPQNLNVQCPEDVPAPEELTATDNCDQNVTVTFEEVEPVQSSASISTAIGEGYALSIPTFIPGSQHYAFASDGTFTQFVDGTARLQGTVLSTVYPEKGWIVDIWLKNRAGWDIWSSNGGIYVDDNALVSNDEFINWDFYVIDADQSRLDGIGDYAGFYLNLSQAAQPANTGFQVGEVANNRNTNWGMYTRFYTNGYFDGQNVLGWGNIFFDGVQGPEFYNECSYDITRVWTATDDCGNSTSVTQTIHVEDTTAPEFTMVPQAISVECGQQVPVSAAMATDNCGDVTITYADSDLLQDNCAGFYIRTFTAVDACGNSATATQIIDIIDTTAPVITACPANASYSCLADVPASNTALVSATDVCSNVTIVLHSEVSTGNDCQGTIVRTYRATDACGNFADCVQVINYNDNVAPVFNNPPVNIYADCASVPALPEVTATDNCSDVTISLTEYNASGGCVGVIVRIYTATDACGNTAVHEQYITLIDTIAPVLHNVPANETILCSDEALQNLFGNPATGGLVAGNNLTFYPNTNILNTTPSIGVYNDAAPGFDGGSFTANGTTKTAIHFTPQQLFGYDITVGDIASMSYYTKRTIAHGVSFPYLNWYLGLLTVADGVDDDTPWFGRQLNMEPYFSSGISAPANQWVQWSTNAGPNRLRVFDPYRGQVQLVYGTFQDPFWNSITSGPINWNALSGAYAPGIYDYTNETILLFNIATGTAWANGFLGQVDGFRIVLNNGDEATINFEPFPDDNEDDDVYATDNCDDSVNVVVSDVVIPGNCPQEFTIERTYSATDSCGNSTSATQIISVVAVPPVISGQDLMLTVNCSETAILPQFIVTDACQENVELVLSVDTISGNCPNEWTEVYTYTATNACGLSATRTVTVHYVDETAPVFTMVPNDLSFECFDDVPEADASELAATDLCGDVTITHLGDAQSGDNCNALISRTYRATDACGNYVDYVQTISVLDTIAPTWDAIAADFTTTCDDVPPPVDCYATDNCTGIAAGFSEVITEGCPTIITRTWTATDDCGNTTSQTQIITVVDEEAPVITSCPENAAYQCLSDIPAADITLVSANDNCSDLTIIHLGDVQQGDNCAGTITRTYRATDVCGNFSNCVQVFEYNDNTAPVFNNPPVNIIADCNNIPAPEQVTATDNCGFVNVTYTQLFASGGCIGVIVRTYTAVDACGNTAVHEQYITLVDTIAPVFTNLPADEYYECDETIPAPAVVLATDNCDSSVNVDFNQTIEEGECANNYTILRTWTATDTCGNSASHTQHIIVSDNTEPIIMAIPSFTLQGCNPEWPALATTWTDNCSDGGVVNGVAGDVVTNGCSQSRVYTFSVADECGNTASSSTTVTRTYDVTAPVIAAIANYTLQGCNPEWPALTTTWTDNCSEGGSLTASAGEVVTNGCTQSRVYTFSVVDACGNPATSSTTVTRTYDVVAPVITCPATLQVDCYDDVPAANVNSVSVSDACSSVTVTWEGDAQQGDSCEGTIIRTYRATDACGNFAECVQIINYSDNDAPVFVDAPADASYTCDDEIPALEDCIAVDNCSSNITYTSVEFIEGYTGEDGLRKCTLTTPFNVLGQPWALWLPNTIGEPMYYYLTPTSGQFIELSNGRAHLTGTVYANNNPNKRWIIDVYFEGRSDWTTWSGLGRSYKDDALVAGLNYIDWTYYIMNADSAILTGDGMYTGSLLNLTHMPSSYLYGFQVGLAANNRNAAEGMSGWFFYEGNWNNGDVNGVGDFAFESECPECDYTITRIWTATDECGNQAIAMQIINVEPASEDEEGVAPEIEFAEGVTFTSWPNPTNAQSTITFKIPNNEKVILEVFNMNGKLIETLYNGDVTANQEYFFKFDGTNHANGLYLYKLSCEKATFIEKLSIIK